MRPPAPTGSAGLVDDGFDGLAPEAAPENDGPDFDPPERGTDGASRRATVAGTDMIFTSSRPLGTRER